MCRAVCVREYHDSMRIILPQCIEMDYWTLEVPYISMILLYVVLAHFGTWAPVSEPRV